MLAIQKNLLFVGILALIGTIFAIALVLSLSGPSSSHADSHFLPFAADYEVHEWGVISGCPESGSWFLTSRPEQLVLVKQPVIYVHAEALDEFSVKATFADGKPTLTYPSASVSGSTATWQKVKVVKAQETQTQGSEQKAYVPKAYLPLESVLPVLSDVDADMLSYNGEHARFLFYEGELSFENKVNATYDIEKKKAIFRNNASYEVYDVTLSVKSGDYMLGKYYMASASLLRPGQQLEVMLEENPDYIDLKAKMVAIGFTQKEAEAFNSLWQMPFSYPTNMPFARLSYRLPQSEVEKLIKLEFSPTPKKLLRTLWVLVDLKASDQKTDGVQKGIVRTCASDSDCSWVSTNCCPESAGAHWECINAELSKLDCMPKGNVCLQVISPRPETECKCVNGYCGGQKSGAKDITITIKTDKKEYEKDEIIKYVVDSGGKTYKIVGYFWENGVKPHIKIGEYWEPIQTFSSYALVECGSSEFCEDYQRFLAEGAPMPRDQNGGTFEWNQDSFLTLAPACKWRNWLGPQKGMRNPYCYQVLKVPAGTYKLILKFSLSVGEEFSAESDEFTIKAPKEISELCAEEKEIIASIKADPLCKDGFRCEDDWSDTYYYDERLTKERPVSPINKPEKLPTALENAVVAEYLESRCSCTSPITYKIATNGGGLKELKEVECETYYSFVKDYNSACNGCLRAWARGCC